MMISARERKRIQRAVRTGATFIAHVLVQRKGNRRLLFRCMAEPLDYIVRVVQKIIHPEEARRIERNLLEDLDRRRHFWDFLKA
jgi:hypothetical protein